MSSLLPEEEKLLLQQVSEGDEASFARLFRAYRDKLFAFIYRLSGSREIAEDLLQDVFLKIWIKRGDLAGIENFNAFLFRMSQNHAINHLRRLSKETLVLMESQKRSHTILSAPDEQVIYNNIRQLLTEIVNGLPPKQKAVYTLSREENLKQEEIAKQLHISVSTVKNHMTQALRTLRKGLKNYYPVTFIAIGMILRSFF